jgi:hypothetical protein
MKVLILCRAPALSSLGRHGGFRVPSQRHRRAPIRLHQPPSCNSPLSFSFCGDGCLALGFLAALEVLVLLVLSPFHRCLRVDVRSLVHAWSPARRQIWPWVNLRLDLTRLDLTMADLWAVLGPRPLRSARICAGTTSLRRGGMVKMVVGVGGALVWQQGWPAACARLVPRRETGLVGSSVSGAAAPGGGLM